jgi:uncharacterized membrane protein YfcA
MAVFDVLAQLDTPTVIMMIVGLAALGCVAGILAGLLGIGGGIVLVPGLLYIFQALGMESESLIHVCVGTSLALIIPNGLMSARSHWKKDAVDMSLVKVIGVGILVGVAIGTIIADNLAGPSLQLVFACAVVVLAILMIVDPSRFKLFQSMPPNPWPSVAGTVIGAISSLIGIGGGTLSVPFMTLSQVPIHRAIGTASALGVVIAVPATLGFMYIGLGEAGRPPFSFGYVNGLAWLLILPTSLLSVKLGVWMAHKAPVKMMKRIFALFLVVVAVKMWMDIL